MPTVEEELKRFRPVIRTISAVSLAGKKVVVWGEENWVLDGPNLVVGNHMGSYKDVAVLFRIVPRPIFFTANKEIFNKQALYFLIRRYLKRHLKDFGWTVDRMITPLKALFADYISTNIGKIGTVPVNLNLQVKTGEAVLRCEEVVRSGRALITLQGRGRIKKKAPNPYVDTFRRGAAFIAYDLYTKYKLPVPVTPIAIYGTQTPVLVPGRITVNVGRPMFITDRAVQGKKETVERFRTALEARVKELFFEIIRTRT